MTKSATILTSTMNEERHFTIPYTGTENWDLCKCCVSSNLPNSHALTTIVRVKVLMEWFRCRHERDDEDTGRHCWRNADGEWRRKWK